MRLTYKRVCFTTIHLSWICSDLFNTPELEALELEEEDESTSYLADLNKTPDYVDEEPVEMGEVRPLSSLLYSTRQTDMPILENQGAA